jgi:hypothetical protein
MGIYINPRDTSKEDFLFQHGKPLTVEEARKYDSDNDRDNALVVWVDHYGNHTAAGVAYSNAERNLFLSPGDKRQRKCYIVPVDKLDFKAGLDDGFPAKFRDKAQWGIK